MKTMKTTKLPLTIEQRDDLFRAMQRAGVETLEDLEAFLVRNEGRAIDDGRVLMRVRTDPDGVGVWAFVKPT